MDFQNNLKDRPKCEYCNNSAFVIAYGVFLCGDCTLKLNTEVAKKRNEEIKAILRS